MINLINDKKKHNLGEEVISEISMSSEGFSGADMENITNESAYIAIERSHLQIEEEDLVDAWKKLVYEKQSVLLSA